MELSTFDRVLPLVRSLLSQTPPPKLHLLLQVKSVAPFVVADADGFTLAQLENTIESMIQDFSFVRAGEETMLYNCQAHIEYEADGRFREVVLSSREMRYGTNFQRANKNVLAQFSLGWALRTELERQNRSFANIRRKRNLMQLLSDEEQGLECDVTQFIRAADRQQFVKQRQAQLIEQGRQCGSTEGDHSGERITLEHIQILRRLRAVMSRQELFVALRECRVASDPQGLRTLRRMIFPNLREELRGTENSHSFANQQESPGEGASPKEQQVLGSQEFEELMRPPTKKLFQRSTIRNLYALYASEPSE